MTEPALDELPARDLSRRGGVAWMVDGVHFAESCRVVALHRHRRCQAPRALVEGFAENQHDRVGRAVLVVAAKPQRASAQAAGWP